MVEEGAKILVVSNNPDVIEKMTDLVQYFGRARLTEETVERDRTLLWTLINNLPDYIFAKDRQGRFLISNEAHARASKITPEELVGKTAFDLFPSHLATQFHADDQNLM